ncbi:MAG TPA: hypothetical protein VML91_19010 [Burkholderiales bacterium]|nr:hypothetical protein [Burkholderiales bacterium]
MRPDRFGRAPHIYTRIADEFLTAFCSARRAARQHAENAEADAAAKAKQKEAVQRAKENSETVAKMKQESLQSDRAYNRNRQVTPEVRQQDLNRAYEDVSRRRRAGESAERTH